MIRDFTLLKSFAVRDTYDKYLRYINKGCLEEETRTILDSYKTYFDKFESDKEVNFDKFHTFFTQVLFCDAPRSRLSVFKDIINAIPSADSAGELEVVKRFKEKELEYKIEDHFLNNKFDCEHLKCLITDHEKSIGYIGTEDSSVVNNDLDKILTRHSTTDGLKWRLRYLNDCVGPIGPGALILVSAYVDVGKTMFAISEASYMAKQLRSGCVLWLNNEEDDYRVYRKIWKSVLGCSDKWLEHNSERAREEYAKRMGGDLERIKFVNIRNKSLREIESLFETYSPSLAVIDQVDKISNVGYKAFSDHDRLKNLYGEVRALANTYCPIIAISQADATTVQVNRETGDASYSLYPHHRQLDGSKVGKPGEADVIIMIGRRADSNTTRGLHVSKNKFGVTSKREVNFDGEKVKYYE